MFVTCDLTCTSISIVKCQHEVAFKRNKMQQFKKFPIDIKQVDQNLVKPNGRPVQEETD